LERGLSGSITRTILSITCRMSLLPVAVAPVCHSRGLTRTATTRLTVPLCLVTSSCSPSACAQTGFVWLDAASWKPSTPSTGIVFHLSYCGARRSRTDPAFGGAPMFGSCLVRARREATTAQRATATCDLKDTWMENLNSCTTILDACCCQWTLDLTQRQSHPGHLGRPATWRHLA
jgi:hypothetical protein